MTNTVAGAEQWARAHVTDPGSSYGFYDGRDWNTMCQALMYRACYLGASADTAYDAWTVSRQHGAWADYSAAPRGAFHWWSTGGAGHVALDLDGSGTRCLMASEFLSGGEDFAPGGRCIGTQSVARYLALSGHSYLGWTLNNMGYQMADVGTPGPSAGSSGSYTLTASDQTVLQTLAARFGGYTGPIDGAMGIYSWEGVQTAVRAYGYTGPIDGVPGTMTYHAIQLLARDGGYTGPQDGILGPYTIAGVSHWLDAHPPAGTPAPGPTPPPPAGSQSYGIDVGTSQSAMDYLVARSNGFQFCVVKAGGSNDGTHAQYTAPYYTAEVDAARAAGFLVGHYWMSGWGDPATDAAYFVAHLHDHRAGDPLMLDVEGADGSPVWTDAQTATFLRAVTSALGVTPFFYTYSALLTSRTWPQTQASGAKLWIADRTSPAGSPKIGTAYPTWAIHQFTIGSVKGVAVDMNLAQPGAFGSAALPPAGANPVGGLGSGISLSDGATLQGVAYLGGYTGPQDGVLGPNSWKGVQTLLTQAQKYTGPIDGVPGVNTYKGLQTLAAGFGYTGPIDGVPGPNTYAGLRNYLSAAAGNITFSTADGTTLQQLGRRGGYTGPLDGVPGTNTWKGVQTALSPNYYSGPIDGVPGPFTFKGVQLLARDYGYTGPIDCVPGPNTYAGVRSYLSVTSTGPGPVSTSDGKTLQVIGVAGGYTGPIDGAPGANTWKGVQTVLRGYGYTGPTDGAPGTNTYKALQTLAMAGGYTGPIDGAMGVNSWKGVQTVMRRFGYTGPIDGAPGTNTYLAMQKMARLGGYAGPLDGALGPYGWAGLQACLRGWGYSGVIDGAPGPGTYTALQRMAEGGGYTGPLDGVPGPYTYQALAKLVS